MPIERTDVAYRQLDVTPEAVAERVHRLLDGGGR